MGIDYIFNINYLFSKCFYNINFYIKYSKFKKI